MRSGPNTLAGLAVLLCLALPPRQARAWDFGGHLKLQGGGSFYGHGDLHGTLGDNPSLDEAGDFRLKAEGRSGSWDAAAHGEVLWLSGGSVPTLKALAASGRAGPGAGGGLLPDDSRRLLNLTAQPVSGPRSQAVARVDRLSLGWSSPRWVLRAGRQALSWSDGLVFHPFDVVSPFPPLALDKEYKTGDDMLYVQRLLPGGADLQAAAVGRRGPPLGRIEADQSSFAAKLRFKSGSLEGSVLGASHYAEATGGLGLVVGAGGGVFRSDAVWTRGKDGRGLLSLVANADRSWTLSGKNVYAFAEYFRSGAGASARSAYLSPPADLSARLQRGELYTLARDYAAAGLQLEAAPLLNIFLTGLLNLDDGSLILQPKAAWDAGRSWILTAGLNLPFGPRGSEFGGLSLPQGFLGPGRSLYLRAAVYF